MPKPGKVAPAAPPAAAYAPAGAEQQWVCLPDSELTQRLAPSGVARLGDSRVCG